MIWGFIGPEGSGKTTAMSAMALRHYTSGGSVLAFPGYQITDGNGKALSKDIDLHEWLSMPMMHKNTLFCADEIQNFMDSKLHGSVFARLVSRVAMQRRKINMGILYTVQNWMWLHDRIRWLTHLLTMCYDLHWSDWGRDQHLGRGEMIRLTTMDCKGFYTGRPWSLLSTKILTAKPLWPHFNSFMPVDIYEGEVKYIIKRQNRIIDLTDAAGEEPPLDIIGKHMEDKAANDNQLLQQLADSGISAAALQNLSRRLRA